MNQPQNPYKPPSMPQGMPPPGMMPPPLMPPSRKKKTWKQRLMTNYGGEMDDLMNKKNLTVPRWLIGKSVVVFFIAYAACRYAFGYPYPTDMIVVASLSVLLFFFGNRELSKMWAHKRENIFLRNVFWIGLVVRLMWGGYSYFIFNPDHYDNRYGDRADVDWYMDFGHGIATWIWEGFPISFGDLIQAYHSAIDDVAYPIWLAIVNLLTFNISDVFLPFVIKSILGAYCAISIYHAAKRHFGEGTARLAALFCMLNPNMIYWCGSMMKEAEMVFLCCLFVEKTDFTLSVNNKLGLRQLIPGIFIGFSLLFMRTALGLVAFMAIFAHLVFVSKKVMSTGKKVLAGMLVGIALLVGVGENFITESREHIESVESGGQKTNMEWRATRKGGNSFAKYASAAVFAPLIFTIPFPTFNQAEADQIIQGLTSGGSYIRNVFSFFVVLVMLLLLASGEWRKHVFILAYTVGYLVILVFSGYAQSGRFHMPIWPMMMLFSAFGIEVIRDNKRVRGGYNLVLLLEVVFCLGWNWFKLKGRGMI